MPGVHLSPEGEVQAEALVRRLSHLPIAAIYVSPLERARETAAPLALHFGLREHVCDDLVDIDFGDWTGCSFTELSRDLAWQRWNSLRSLGVPPNGESMLAAQGRAVRVLEQMRFLHPHDLVAVVSYGDIIKSALAHYLGVHLDMFQRIEISPASVSVVVHDFAPRVVCINHTGEVQVGSERRDKVVASFAR
jgi:probable phosphoglycerate mutase